jgi:TolB-like protein/DNA-binding winged helix-turn-helix (wHTH) protein/tetratricopeptide (TPR) repeat protein
VPQSGLAKAEAFPHGYRFGVFMLDARSGDLRKHGIPIKLQDRPAQALLALIERQGELVTRQEIRQRLWAEDTFVDFEHSISSAINKARAALNDSAKHPRYIETVGRQGYRFIYPVTPVYAAVVPEPATSQSPQHGLNRWMFFAAAVALVVIAAGGLKYWQVRENAHASVRSIAVLPLKNLSNDPEQEFLAEGLTDELITRLASLQGLKVISWTSSMQYKDSKKPLPQIAKELDVDAVVEGTLLRSGQRVRITAQLIHARDDHHIWAESYERDQRDILAVQNEVTSAIADSIQLQIAPATRQELAVKRPIDPEAHEDYLRGMHFWEKRTMADFHTAIDYFERAIARDPNYAPAYAGMANTYALMGGYSVVAQGPFIEKARQAALRALDLDPRLPDGHVALAVIAQNYDWDWQKAETEYRRAIELDANNATAHQWYAEFLSYQGRFEEALAESAKAETLDPLSLVIQTDRGVVLLYAREYKRSIEQFKIVLAKDPTYPRAHTIQSAYVQTGQFDLALRDAEQFNRELHTRASEAQLGFVLARTGEAHAARAILKDLQRTADAQTDPSAVLSVQLGLNDREGAFASLERAYQLHSNVISTLKVSPMYDPLRRDPRFTELMKRVGLAR